MLLLGEILAVIYIGGIAKVAGLTGTAYVLFPELGALSYDIFARPKGTWARAPLMLVVTPVLTAVVGVLIEQNMTYGFLSVFLCVLSALLIIKWLNSPIAPAISAGLIPIALSQGSWWYPVSIAFGTALLAACSIFYRRIFAKAINGMPSPPGDAEDNMTEQPPGQYLWLPFFVVFLLLEILLVKITGLRFILFPPLVVIGFEMFAHAEVCPWAGKPILLCIACIITAAAGVETVSALGTGSVAAILTVVFGVVVVRIFKLHIPPVVAVGLLPFVLDHPDFWFPVAVGAGTLILAVTFILYRKVAVWKGTAS